MCVYSMIADHYIDKWVPTPYKYPTTSPPIVLPDFPVGTTKKVPTIEEIQEMLELLKKAKEYDEKTNQKDCELEEKKEALRQVAKLLGVEIQFP